MVIDVNYKSKSTICPYLDDSDIRCESRFSLSRLKDAFELCVGHYDECPLYRQLKDEELSRTTRQLVAAVGE